MSQNKVENTSLPDRQKLGFKFNREEAKETFMYFAQTREDEPRAEEYDPWGEGKIRKFKDLTISPAAVALNYGQAAFEGLKAFRIPKIKADQPDDRIMLFRPQENARRFERSARRLVMPPVPVKRFIEAVEEVVRRNKRFVPNHDEGSLYIRPVMIGSGEVLGVDPAPSYTFYIYVQRVGEYRKEGGGRFIVLDDTDRVALHSTGNIKAAGNYAGTLLPREIAKKKGYTDVLYLDSRHSQFVEELGSSNFFAVYDDNTLVTPDLDGSILPGITRDSVIEIARHKGWAVEQRPLSIQEVLARAKEAFFTGTAAAIQPIRMIHYNNTNHTIGAGLEGEMTRELRVSLVNIQTGQDDPFNWMHEVEL
ncbi:MAG TPA: branched-chain amino acid aminotransferase [Blastocatellia bacterium]|jgi:branched-chain amino acid aminotransferase